MTPAHPRQHVVHLTSVHHPLDPRIRLKQLASIVSSGFEVTLVAAGTRYDMPDDGVRVEHVRPWVRKRWWRMIVTAPRVVLRALRIPAQIYHFHDPELVPWAWVLLLRGVPVIYDVHEDYTRAISQKPYLPRSIRPLVGLLVGAMERALTLPFAIIIAEACYAGRFPGATGVFNYPVRPQATQCRVPEARQTSLIYTGNVTIERGALPMAGLVAADPSLRIMTIGRCDPRTARAMRAIAGSAADRLTIVGEGRFVSHDEIMTEVSSGNHLAGLVLIPDSPHYREKHLTKFFEFMAAGLPIIASDVPAWRALIQDQGVGLCVDPTDTAQVLGAVAALRHNPHRAHTMGEAGRRLVREAYNWETQAAALLSLYRKLMERAHTS